MFGFEFRIGFGVFRMGIGVLDLVNGFIFDRVYV